MVANVGFLDNIAGAEENARRMALHQATVTKDSKDLFEKLEALNSEQERLKLPIQVQYDTALTVVIVVAAIFTHIFGNVLWAGAVLAINIYPWLNWRQKKAEIQHKRDEDISKINSDIKTTKQKFDQELANLSNIYRSIIDAFQEKGKSKANYIMVQYNQNWSQLTSYKKPREGRYETDVILQCLEELGSQYEAQSKLYIEWKIWANKIAALQFPKYAPEVSGGGYSMIHYFQRCFFDMNHYLAIDARPGVPGKVCIQISDYQVVPKYR